jgi:UPF0148 protein
MLSMNCPECSSPLFQLKTGEIFCPSCKRRVVIVPEAADESVVATGEILWESLQRTLMEKISSVNRMLSAETEPAKVRELSEIVSSLLASMERLRRIRKS